MKKIFDLQLFADEAGTAAGGAVTDAPVSVSEKTDEPTKAAEPAPAATLKRKTRSTRMRMSTTF